MAWVFQDSRQRQKLGEKRCPWSVGWTDPQTGRPRSKKVGCKSMAIKFKRKKEGELAAGLCETESRITWVDFRKQYEDHVRSRNRLSTLQADRTAFDHFERIIRPGRLTAVKTVTIEQYVDVRSQERVQGGLAVAPAHNQPGA